MKKIRFFIVLILMMISANSWAAKEISLCQNDRDCLVGQRCINNLCQIFVSQNTIQKSTNKISAGTKETDVDIKAVNAKTCEECRELKTWSCMSCSTDKKEKTALCEFNPSVTRERKKYVYKGNCCPVVLLGDQYYSYDGTDGITDEIVYKSFRDYLKGRGAVPTETDGCLDGQYKVECPNELLELKYYADNRWECVCKNGGQIVPAVDTNGKQISGEIGCCSYSTDVFYQKEGICCDKDESMENGKCLCGLICSDGKVLDPESCSCYCPDGRLENSDGNCGCPACPIAGQIADENCQCSCPMGKVLNPMGTLCICDTICPYEMTLNEENCQCSCPTGKIPNAEGTECVCPTCPIVGQIADDNCQCSCPDGRVLNKEGTACACDKNCPYTMQLDLNTCSCICPAGKVPNAEGDACVCPTACEDGEVQNKDCSCSCPTGKVKDKDGNCVCDACAIFGQISDENCTCSCPDGRVLNKEGTACICDKNCPYTMQLDLNTCSCICPAGKVPNAEGNDCICPTACEDGKVQNKDCSCSCPAGKELNENGECVCPVCPIFGQEADDNCQCSCSQNRVLNKEGTACICDKNCPYTMQLDLNTCSCICPAGKVPNAQGNACVCSNTCPVGYRQNTDCSCSSICPEEKVYSNGECVCRTTCGAGYNQNADCSCSSICSENQIYVNGKCVSKLCEKMPTCNSAEASDKFPCYFSQGVGKNFGREYVKAARAQCQAIGRTLLSAEQVKAYQNTGCALKGGAGYLNTCEGTLAYIGPFSLSRTIKYYGNYTRVISFVNQGCSEGPECAILNSKGTWSYHTVNPGDGTGDSWKPWTGAVCGPKI